MREDCFPLPKVSEAYKKEKAGSILRSAEKVFIRKGFDETTMQDIVNECKISRGNLYMYFSSTDEIFIRLLEYDLQRTEEINVISGSGQSAMQLLTAFLSDHKEGILHIRDTLIPSSYEFFIKHCNDGADREIIRRRYEDAAQIIRKILDFGESNNEFRLNDDSANIAKFIMIFLEGLITTALSVGLDEEAVDNQIGIFIGILKMKLLK